jgi:iron(III) transport system ATP-binding protein
MADGSVHVGPLRIKPRCAIQPGAIKAAIRPEAWVIGPHGAAGLDGAVAKHAYLGSFSELTIDTALGPIFVVSSDTTHDWSIGDRLTLSLTGRGVSVVPG